MAQIALSQLKLDDLVPGLSVKEALRIPHWREEDGFLVSTSYGDLSLGAEYSFAELKGEIIQKVIGKILYLNDKKVAEVGQPWSEVRLALDLEPGQQVIEESESSLGLSFIRSDKGVSIIQLYQLPYLLE